MRLYSTAQSPTSCVRTDEVHQTGGPVPVPPGVTELHSQPRSVIRIVTASIPVLPENINSESRLEVSEPAPDEEPIFFVVDSEFRILDHGTVIKQNKQRNQFSEKEGIPTTSLSVNGHPRCTAIVPDPAGTVWTSSSFAWPTTSAFSPPPGCEAPGTRRLGGLQVGIFLLHNA